MKTERGRQHEVICIRDACFAVHGSEHPVSFVLKHESFGLNAVAAKRSEQLQALIDGHAEILLIRDHESRRFDLVR